MFRIYDSLLDNLLLSLCQENEFVFLDTSMPTEENSKSLLFVTPSARLVCRRGDDLQSYLSLLQEKLDEGFYLAGWFGYEFGALLEGRLGQYTRSFSDPPDILADFGVFFKPYKFNHSRGTSDFPCSSHPDDRPENWSFSISHLKPNMEKDEFVDAIEKVRDYIGAGDTYQVNYTMKLLFDFHGSVEGLYRRLRRNQSVGYGAFIKSGGESILSFSPELFFRKSNSEITVRPMKGTVTRGNNLAQERAFAEFLESDPKNRAENVMIVDLLRNDLARLLYGEKDTAVTTKSLFDVESYESLLQMTSTVKGRIIDKKLPELTISRLIQSLFPCGSVTGAPKIRTMQIIDELEKESRGVYTGTIGFMAPDGEAVFNVPIRTVHLKEEKGEMGIGAGITYGSVGEEEWDESLLKGRFLTHAQEKFQIFETMLWQQESSYYLLEMHLERLSRAADFFKFSYHDDSIRSQLVKEAGGFADPCMRVRLVLEKDGRAEVEAVACDPPAYVSLPEPGELDQRKICGKVNVSIEKSPQLDPFLLHKTTKRAIYNSEHKKAVDRGCIDTIFINESGEVTEGCISNVIVFKEGRYITPPLDCGLLPGVMRQALLESMVGLVVEEVVTREDLYSADAVFICNSVRGVVHVALVK